MSRRKRHVLTRIVPAIILTSIVIHGVAFAIYLFTGVFYWLLSIGISFTAAWIVGVGMSHDFGGDSRRKNVPGKPS